MSIHLLKFKYRSDQDLLCVLSVIHSKYPVEQNSVEGKLLNMEETFMYQLIKKVRKDLALQT